MLLKNYLSFFCSILICFSCSFSVKEKSLSQTENRILCCSILGDSYSTFGGFVTPESNRCFYNGESKESDVLNIEETWWYQIILKKGYKLEYNNSTVGSTICNTGYGGNDASDFSFVTRMKNIGRPDIIFIFGGTNDSWADSPIGDYKYSDITSEDLKFFRPSFAYMLDYLLKHNPNAKIYNIVNTELDLDITNSMATICKYYGVNNIVLPPFDKPFHQHPSKAGMETIANFIIDNMDVDISGK